MAPTPTRVVPYMLIAPKSTSTLCPARSKLALAMLAVVAVLLPMFRAARPMPVASRMTKVPVVVLNCRVPPARPPVPILTVVA